MTDYRMPGDIDLKLAKALDHVPQIEKMRAAWDRFADKHNIDREAAAAAGDAVLDSMGQPVLLTEVWKAGQRKLINLLLVEKPDGEIEFEAKDAD